MPRRNGTSQDDNAISLAHVKREKAESEALFLSIGEGAIVTDERGNISRINQAALDILGYTADELLGKWFPGVIIAEDESGHVIPNIERPIVNVFVLGRPVSTRLYYRRKDGSKVIVYLTASPVILDGKPTGAIEVFRDVTREYELERAKDEFISLASHQLRTPASAVKQYTDMLIHGFAGKLSQQQIDMAKVIYECNEREIVIIDDLLHVAQIDAGQIRLRLRVVDMCALAQDVLRDSGAKFQDRSQNVTYVSEESVIKARVDPQLFRMALENIVDNASKYTPHHKSITVSLYRQGSHVSIHVADEGVGIDADDLPLLFTKFSRVPNPLSDIVGGTGLGLYLAKKIINLHGGGIRVRPSEPEGTTFIIRVPLLL